MHEPKLHNTARSQHEFINYNKPVSQTQINNTHISVPLIPCSVSRQPKVISE